MRAKLGPTLQKYLLNALAITSESVISTPSTTGAQLEIFARGCSKIGQIKMLKRYYKFAY